MTPSALAQAFNRGSSHVPEIYEDHPYLYHYTTFEGLVGILATQTLWATHYKALNDSSEVEQMRGLLERSTFKIVNSVVRKKAKDSFAYKRFLRKHGGLAACSHKEAQNIIDNFYEVTFAERMGRAPMAEPYVVSFCAHTNETDYVNKVHGAAFRNYPIISG